MRTHHGCGLAAVMALLLSSASPAQVGRAEEDAPAATASSGDKNGARKSPRRGRKKRKSLSGVTAGGGASGGGSSGGGASAGTVAEPRQVQVAAVTPPRLGAEPASIAPASSSVVSVRASNLTYRLFLAPNAVCLVEFPWDDAVYSVHPGDTNYVMLDGLEGERRRDPSDALVFRPGAGFDPKSKDVQTMYTIQFVSGFVLTLLFEPTNDIAQNSNRVVLRYQVAEIRNYRRSIGLPDNMVRQESPSVLRTDFELESDPEVEAFSLPAATERRGARSVGRLGGRRSGSGRFDHLTALEEDVAGVEQDFDPSSGSMRRGGLTRADRVGGSRFAVQQPYGGEPMDEAEDEEEIEIGTSEEARGRTKLLNELRDIIHEANQRAINPKTLAPGRDGLVVVLLGTYEDENFEGVVRYALALTNTSSKPMYILSLSPDVLVTTTVKKDRTVVNSERLPVLAYAATTRSRHIRPGQIVYVACAVNRPILSSTQRLSISYAHADAADRPVEAVAPQFGRRKSRKRDE